MLSSLDGNCQSVMYETTTMHTKCPDLHSSSLYKVIHRLTNLTAFGALICLSTPFLSLSASFAMSLDDTQGGAGVEEDSKILHW